MRKPEDATRASVDVLAQAAPRTLAEAERSVLEAREEIDQILGAVDAPRLLASFSLLAAFAQSFRNLDEIFNENPGLPYVTNRVAPFRTEAPAPTSDQLLMLCRQLGRLFLWQQRAETYAALAEYPKAESRDAVRLAQVHHRIEAVNPDIYIHQLAEVMRGVYAPLDDFFVERLGFSASEGFAAALSIMQTVSSFLVRSRSSLEGALRAADRAAKFDNTAPVPASALEPILAAAENLILKIGEATPAVRQFLARLARPVSGAYAGGSPLLFSLPNGKVLVPDPRRLLFGLRATLDDALDGERLHQTVIWQRFQKTRARFLEERVAEYLTRVFPAASIHGRCYYELDGRRHELDLLIDFDGWLLAVEAKAGDLSDAARRGAGKSLERDLRKLLGDAHAQGQNVIRYVSQGAPVIFRDSQGRVLHVVTDRPRHVRVINVTLEHLMSFGVRQKPLQEFGLFREGDFLWAVNLFDLDIITSYSGSPSLFLYFVDRRIAAQSSGLFHAFDELTVFGYFCSVGSLAPPRMGDGGAVDSVSLAGDFLNQFDRHYMHSGKAPEVKLESLVRQIIQDLEDVGSRGWTDVAGLLLDIPRGGQRQLVKSVVATLKRCRKKRRMADFSLTRGDGVSLTYLVVAEASDSREFLQMWCSRKASETGKNVWLGLLKILGRPGRYVSDWVVIRRPENGKDAAKTV